MKRFSFLAAFAFALALVGCGGGGGSPTAPAVNRPTKTAATATPSPTPTLAPSLVSFTIVVPSATPQPAAKRRYYISTNTESIAIQQFTEASPPMPVAKAIVANLTASSPGCAVVTAGLQCTVTGPAVAGTYDFSVISYAGKNATGAVLAQNTLTSTTIVAGTTSALNATLYGVIGLVVVPNSVSGTLVLPETVTFSVDDASGETIVGTGTYDNGPLTVTDPQGLTKLTPSSFSGPSAASSFAMQCLSVGNGTLQFADFTGALASVNYDCSSNTVILNPGALDFDALAANQSDPTYDQIVTVTDTNTGVTSQAPLLSCTPGPGATSSTIALAFHTGNETWAIRPLDVGTCTFAVQDTLTGGSTQTSQVISIEIHTSGFVINSRAREHQ